MDIISTMKGSDSKAYVFLLAVTFLAPLLPEYVAPFLTVLLAVYCIAAAKEKRLNLSADSFVMLELGFISYCFISVIWSSDKTYTLLYSTLLLLLFSGHVVMCSLINTKQRLQAVIHCILYSGVIVAGIGVLQAASVFLRLTGLSVPSFPNPFYRQMDSFVFDILRNMFGLGIKTNVYTGRSNGTFSNPNIYAAFLVMVYPLAVYYLLKARRTYKKLSYGAATVTIALGIAVSQSRAAVLALGVSTTLMIFGNRRNIRKLLVLVGGFIAGLVVVYLRLNRTEALSELKRFTGSFWGHRFDVYVNPSTHTHLRLYEAAFDIISTDLSNMFIGLGAGINNAWQVFLNQYNINQPHAHNLILELWIEGGIVGVSLFLTSVLAILYVLKQILRCSPESRHVSLAIMAGFVGILTFQITDFVLFDPKIIQFYFFLCGLASAAVRLYSKRDTADSEQDMRFSNE